MSQSSVQKDSSGSVTAEFTQKSRQKALEHSYKGPGHGKALWSMQGMFKANGGCGYVKKPDILSKNDDPNDVFDPKEELEVKKILKVKVYTGDGWRFDFGKHHFDY